MTIRSVMWNSCTALECGSLPADAKLCVPAVLVDADSDNELLFIDAIVKERTVPCSPCGGVFQYLITYNDSQLASYDPETLTAEIPLYPSQIHAVFCNQCLLALIAAQLPPEDNNWHLTGNAGTTEGTSFIGTIDAIPFETRVKNVRVGLIDFDAVSPNITNGGYENEVLTTLGAATLSGGGDGTNVFHTKNIVRASSDYSVIVGGMTNDLTGSASGIAFGEGHTIRGSSLNGILAGQSNLIDNTSGAPLGSVIVGGIGNTIRSASESLIGLGHFHVLEGDTLTIGDVTLSSHNAILSGFENKTDPDSYFSVILGGAKLKVGRTTVGYQNPLTRTDFNTEDASQIDLTAFSSLMYLGDLNFWLGNTDGTARQLKFFEPNTVLDYSTTNYSSIRAQGQSANIEYVLPAAAGSVGQVLKIASVSGTTVTLQWANDNT